MLPNYYQHGRPEMVKYVPESAQRILEIGCGEGTFARTLQARGNCSVVGLELVESAAQQARAAGLEVIVGNAEHLDLGTLGTFDCIVFNDSLEHMSDPWSVLKRTRSILVPGGCVVASIPNIRNYNTLRQLAFDGNFNYQDSGVLDRTHLRFFTKESMSEMFAEAGYRVTTQDGLGWIQIPIWLSILNRLTRRRWQDLRYEQFACVAELGACP